MKGSKNTSSTLNRLLLAAIGVGTFVTWAAVNQSRPAAAWPTLVDGYAFSPLRRGQDPSRGEYPSHAEIEADLRLLAGHSGAIRTYSLNGTLREIPRIAARLGFDVTVGVELNKDPRRNRAQLAALRAVELSTDNLKRAIIGNEMLLTSMLAIDDLKRTLSRARRESGLAISTAEPWHVWLEYPELAHHVDFITVHLLPYWEGIHVDEAVNFVIARLATLKETFPEKPILIGEVGWPSFGRTRGRAVASPANAAAFLREFTSRAHDLGYDYFLMEAFDQPWKRSIEGEVGAYWGIYDVDRRLKLQLTGPIAPLPGWGLWSLLAAVLASLAFRTMVADGHRFEARGRTFMAFIAAAMATGCLWTFSLHSTRYWSVVDAPAAVLMLVGTLGIVLLVLVEAHEWAEARWCARARPPSPAESAHPGRLPKVSIHLPAHEEPPELLLETLSALARLDYPNFEVLVIDNNTADEQLWRPVEAFCSHLGANFRFYHVNPLQGYKAGALNFALRHTANDASIVAVIDSDYKVDPRWLRDLVPEFTAPAVAIVQAPQDYRDGESSVFKAMCAAEYQGFFKIGMVTRNDRNAIIQHGTMTMIRKRVLREVGGWAEWTITEDAELGLRVLEHGYEARYIRTSYGKGLTPDNFQDYKTQRFRWAVGASQILRRHGPLLIGTKPSALTRGQRYHFVAGWLPWLADGFNLFFTALALAWSVLVLIAPAHFHAPLASFSTFVLALFVFKLAKVLMLYRARVGTSFGRSLGAAVTGLSLVYTIGRAVILGFFVQDARFLRTPKLAHPHTLRGALYAAAPETALASALLACAVGISTTGTFESIDRDVWAALLVVLAVPHLSALLLAVTNSLPWIRAKGVARGPDNVIGGGRRP